MTWLSSFLGLELGFGSTPEASKGLGFNVVGWLKVSAVAWASGVTIVTGAQDPEGRTGVEGVTCETLNPKPKTRNLRSSIS